MNLSNFGQKLKFEESKISKEKKEKELFVDIVNNLEQSFNNSANIFTTFKIDLFKYEEGYYRAIEDLLLLNFGVWKTELILWYVYEGKNEHGKPNPLEIELPNGETKAIKFPTAISLWNFMVKMDKQLNQNEDI
jgi:hypothetical protein